MKKFLVLFLVVSGCFSSIKTLGQVRVMAYEGFDYYRNNLSTRIWKNGGPPQAIKQTKIPQKNTSNQGLYLYNSTHPTTNSSVSLGWAGDWIESNTTSDPNGFYIETINSFEVTSNTELFSLINTGFYARGGQFSIPGSGETLGRRLQTSTGGPFYLYSITGAPLPNGTDPTSPNKVVTAANSPLRSNGSTARVNHPSSTFNNRIGADGTTVWFSCMLRKDDFTNNEAAFIDLHRNPDPTDTTGLDINIGYFGAASNNGANKHWGVRVGNVFNNFLPGATQMAQGRFDLLVASISYNYTTGHIINLYVISDKTMDPVNAAKLDNYPAAPVTPDITMNVGTADISFHSLAYFGGDSNFQSALDEIRFGPSFEAVALSSKSISVIKGLCTGFIGDNIYSEGSFGTAQSLNSSGVLTSAAAGETQGSASVWADQVDAYGVNSRPVIFKNATTQINPPTNTTQYQNIAPGFLYKVDLSGQPDDGSYTVVSQTRGPFGWDADGLVLSWIKAYDNDGDGKKNGEMMIVNAAYNPGKFYEQTIYGVCAGTQYEFYVDALNLFKSEIKTITGSGTSVASFSPRCDPSTEPGCFQMSSPGTDQSGASGIGAASNGSGSGSSTKYNLNPELEFLIDDVVAYIPPISIANDTVWHRVGFTFVTKPSVVGKIKLSIRNRAPGGIGNDLAIDNITFRPCGPVAAIDPPIIGCSTSKVSIVVSGPAKGFDYYQWQRKNGGAWINIGTADTTGLTLSPGVISDGDTIRAVVAGGSNPALYADSSKCKVFSPFSIVSCATLPVSWLSFSGTVQPEGVKLIWQTAYEKDALSYDIQRSDDSQNFITVGNVSAKGVDGKDGKVDYSFFDSSPGQGVNYYRLKLIQKTPDIQYSKIISVNVEDNFIVVFPNPAKDQVNIRFGKEFALKNNIEIVFKSILGSTVKSIAKTVDSSSREINIDTRDLATGVYIIEINTGVSLVKRKIIITQ